MQRITIRNAPEQNIGVENASEQQIKFGNSHTIIIGGDPYEGEYTVNPDFIGKILRTNGKMMRDDVTVNAIEVQRVSNPSGGRTIYIGGEING